MCQTSLCISQQREDWVVLLVHYAGRTRTWLLTQSLMTMKWQSHSKLNVETPQRQDDEPGDSAKSQILLKVTFSLLDHPNPNRLELYHSFHWHMHFKFQFCYATPFVILQNFEVFVSNLAAIIFCCTILICMHKFA